MRLLNTTTYTLETFIGANTPRYVILSHIWGNDEVLFEDIQAALQDKSADESEQKWRKKSGAKKVLDAAKKASRNGFKYIWIDTCCIDKSSSAELSEAINSMYRWYQDSAVCYVYLSDVHSGNVDSNGAGFLDLDFNDVGPADVYLSDVNSNDVEDGVTFEESRWFRRGWTEWKGIGSRHSLATTISTVTRIDTSLLESPLEYHLKRPRLEVFSIHTRMTWAYMRETTRPEDRAYCMMGIFDVNMPLLYGEGIVKAFARLQEEIIKGYHDQSILLHINPGNTLASTPDDFLPTHQFELSHKSPPYGLESTSSGHRTSLLLHPNFVGSTLAILEVVFAEDPSMLCRPAIQLGPRGTDEFDRRSGNVYQKASLTAYGGLQNFASHYFNIHKDVRKVILKNAPKQDSSSRFSMPVSDGVRITVALKWLTFLETEIIDFEAEIAEEISGEPKTAAPACEAKKTNSEALATLPSNIVNSTKIPKDRYRIRRCA
ncbi:hypothetical protein EKO27_g11037 [Xylaria grammica]|uniref:Heterokaryon incompatibility domain-containing protein n=1 Tax=Xylaria grammica TaxID=363999 RepID=A0A439CPI2_9PEZI|nr:hypothetical protein EKO27_g11037 [Xylaria grammica]